MAANYLHGVESVEVDSGPRPVRGVKTAVIGLVGTAPLWAVDAAERTVDRPVLVLSDRDARRCFGPQTAGYTIPQAIDAIFDQGRGIVVAVNVFDPLVHKTAVAPAEQAFGAAGTAAADRLVLPHQGVAAVVVQSRDGQTTYVADTDYTVEAATGVITRVAGGAIAAGATVRVGYDRPDPSKVTAADLIGAVDGGGTRTGLQALLDSQPLFGFAPKLLIAPGFSPLASVAAELVAMAGRLRAMALIDAPVGTTVAQALAGRGPEGAIAFRTGSERAILCYPHLRVYDPAADAERLEPLSQRLAGVMAAKDLDRGYWWSPSNTEILGITGIERPLTAGINDPASEVNLLNEAGILTVFNAYGTGFRTWGNRSAAWPASTAPANVINIRRVADVLHESVEYSMLQFLDQPVTPAWIDAVAESVNAFIRTLIGRGALIDGSCRYDAAKNPETELALGHVTFDLAFMPPPPAERVTFESFIDLKLLAALNRAAG